MAELINMDIVVRTLFGNWVVGVVERETDDDSFLYEIVHRNEDFAGEVLARINLVKGGKFIISSQASDPYPEGKDDPCYKWENPTTRHSVTEALGDAARLAYARNAELVAEKQKAEDDAHMLQVRRDEFLAALEQQRVRERESGEE